VAANILSTAPAWNLQGALRWLTGSLNGAQLSDSANLLFALALCGAILFSQHRDLEALA